MKTIGLLGGMSWESTIPYCRIINETVRERLGGPHSARLVLCSVDFGQVESLMRAGDWQGVALELTRGARARRAVLAGATDSPVPLFDTTELHARRAAELALGAAATLE